MSVTKIYTSGNSAVIEKDGATHFGAALSHAIRRNGDVFTITHIETGKQYISPYTEIHDSGDAAKADADATQTYLTSVL